MGIEKSELYLFTRDFCFALHGDWVASRNKEVTTGGLDQLNAWGSELETLLANTGEKSNG
jgi:hypothetical protein